MTRSGGKGQLEARGAARARRGRGTGDRMVAVRHWGGIQDRDGGIPDRVGYQTGMVGFQTGMARFQTGMVVFQTGMVGFQTGDGIPDAGEVLDMG